MRAPRRTNFQAQLLDRSGSCYAYGQEWHWSVITLWIIGRSLVLILSPFLGTDATIAQHIQTIIEREYVIERMAGGTKYLIPSTLGIGLIEGYNRIGLAKNVSKPQLRREVGTHRNPHLPLNFTLFFGRLNVEWCKFVKAQAPKMICLLEVLNSINICTLL
jgi:hypothetical protein